MSAIWFGDGPMTLTRLPGLLPGIAEHIGIEFLEAGPDWLEARMPVDQRTRQPFGLLHGGASVVLAETLASVASLAVVDVRAHRCVGLEINANHLRAATQGWVIGRATPIHLGRTTHVWDIRIRDEAGKPVCVSRCTMAVVAHKGVEVRT